MDSLEGIICSGGNLSKTKHFSIPGDFVFTSFTVLKSVNLVKPEPTYTKYRLLLKICLVSTEKKYHTDIKV